MNKHGVFLLVALLGAALPVVADRETPVANDYATGYDLEGGNGSIRYLPLTAELYRGMVREDASDIAVFNAAGRQAPHLVEGQAKKVDSRRTQSLPFFPILGQEVDASVTFWQYDEQPQSFEMRYRSWREKREQTPDEASSYILKNDVRNDRLTKLTVDWSQKQTSMIAAVRVEVSSDMTNWKPLVARAVLSRLSHDGGTLEQNAITLKPTTAKFLRLTWIKGNPGIAINRLMADYSSATNGVARQWIELDPIRPSPEKVDSFLFDTGGPIPVRRMAFKIPVDGLYYRGKLYSRTNAEQQWRYRANISQYRLELDGLTTTSSSLALPDLRDRYWKLELDQPRNLQSSDYPVISIQPQPERLVFLAQGESPFLLAVGSRHVDKQTFRLPLHNKLPKDFGKQTEALMRLGSQRVLGGENRLQQPRAPLDMKTWLLWFVLVVGVLVMAWMARGLMKEMTPKE